MEVWLRSEPAEGLSVGASATGIEALTAFQRSLTQRSACNVVHLLDMERQHPDVAISLQPCWRNAMRRERVAGSHLRR